MMMQMLAWLEATSFSTWVRESSSIWAYPTVLTLHTVGLAMLVGASWVLDLRVLGLAKAISLAELSKSFRIMWLGFWVNAVSGAILFAGDATTKGATWLFVWKLALVAIGVATVILIRRNVYGRGLAGAAPVGLAAKALAVTSLVVWAAAIAAGRFMAYL
jgi:hypothetical protein